MSLPMNGTWTTGAPMPTPRNNFACAYIKNKIYCAAGFIGDAMASTNVLEIYDTESNYWAIAKSMPKPLGGMGVATVDNEIYCIGGTSLNTISNNIYVYNTVTNSWSISPHTLPTARYGLRCCYTNRKIYCVGGITHTSGVFTDKVEILDIVSGTWTTGSPLPQKLALGCLHHNDEHLYWIGGGYSPGTINSRKTYIYDIASNNWTEGCELPTSRHNYGSDILNENIYFIGGKDYDKKQLLNTFFAYDINHNTNIVLPSMSTIRNGCCSAIVNNKFYVIGGDTDGQFNNTVEIYPAEAPTPPPGDKCCCTKVKIGIETCSCNIDLIKGLSSLLEEDGQKGCGTSGCDK